jgi:tetratricopeptide (TPR) repeat protein
LLLKTLQTEKALQLTKRTLALFPNNPRFTLQAAWANQAMKRYDDSLRLYEKTESLAQAVAPDLLNDDFYQSWGDTLQGTKQFEDAEQKYQKSIALVPQDDPARAAIVLNNLGYMWLDQGKNLDQAGEFIQKANQLQPKNPVYLDSLGWFHFKKGRYPEALKVLEEVEAAIKEPNIEDAEIFDHIGQTYAKLGNRAKALDYFKKASLLDPGASKIREHYEQAKQ